jgi:hypothetical protein
LESDCGFLRLSVAATKEDLMFARIATFESTDPAADEKLMDEAMGIVQPIIQGMKGIQGHMELADRNSGRALSISLFDTEENAIAAEPVFDEEMPKALGEIMERFSGRRVSVERYAVLVDERVPSATTA